ncbi:MAG: ThiF family adenylyltransferase [Thermoplasmata archaeon]|nr:ThiF family adenylyltransferase [Thermoplasmata archaeon]
MALTCGSFYDMRLELDISRAGKVSTYGNKNYLPSNIHIFVIGCGGNGGYLVPQVMRYVRSFTNKQDIPTPAGRQTPQKFNMDITLIDGDTIEEKNLIRQNFIKPDVGKNKARVMAERYGRAFGLEVGIVERYLNMDLAADLIATKTGSVIILGCVDNNATRKIIYEDIWHETEKAQRADHMFWLDVANEMFDGQVVIGYRHKSHGNPTGYGTNQLPGPMRTREWWNDTLVAKVERSSQGIDLLRRGVHFPMPCIAEVYPDILEGEPDFDPDDPSCAEAVEQVDQAMATNIMSASQIFSAFCQTMAALTDFRLEGEEADNTERRPRAYLINFGHGGRSSLKFNTINNLKEIFLRNVPEEEEDNEDDS